MNEIIILSKSRLLPSVTTYRVEKFRLPNAVPFVGASLHWDQSERAFARVSLSYLATF